MVPPEGAPDTSVGSDLPGEEAGARARRWLPRGVDLDIRWKALLAAGIPTLGLVVGPIAFIMVNRSASAANEKVQQALEATATLAQITTLTLDAESSTRAYVITRDPLLLAQVTTAGNDLPKLLASVSPLISDTSQRHDLDDLRTLVSTRFTQLEQARAQAEQDADEATLAAAVGEGSALTNEIRDLAATMQTRQEVLLGARQGRARDVSQTATGIAVGSLVVGGFGGALVTSRLASGLTRRLRHLLRDAERLASGVPAESVVEGDDEVGRLGRDLRAASVVLRSREEELTETRHFLQHVLDTAPMMVTRRSAGLDPRLTYVSPNVEHVLGCTPEEMLAAGNMLAWVHPDDVELVVGHRDAIATGRQRASRLEIRMRRADGGYSWFAVSAFAENDEPRDGAAAVLAYYVDVTDRRTAEEAEREARQAADTANLAKSEFLSRMSHELRTPLNAVLGFGQLLEFEELTDSQRESVEHILKAGRHLLELIDDVLDISRVETGQLDLSIRPISIQEVASEATELLRPSANAGDISLELALAGPVGLSAFADRRRLKQILLNLVSNALKYNRPGGWVRVESAESEGRVRVKVSDSGPGITPEQLDRLFIPFDRLDAASGSVEGTGIGLALSQRLAEAMDGAIGVESTPGVGSTFWIELPAAPRSADDTAAPSPLDHLPRPAPGASRKILYIEDNLSNLQVIEGLLARWPGIEVIPSLSGELGLGLARAHLPSLLILDLHLPDMSGSAVLAALRADPRTAQIPVIVLTADATHGQRARMLALGADLFLTKPVDVSELLGHLDRLLGATGTPEPAS